MPDASSCILCGAAGVPLFRDAVWDLLRCKECALAWVANPPPLATTTAWRDIALDLTLESAGVEATLVRAGVRMRLPQRPLRVLDLVYGEAFCRKILNGSKDLLLGRCARPLRDAVLRATKGNARDGEAGWEQAKACAGSAPPGIAIHARPLAEIALPPDTFDVALLSDLASHLPDPVEYVRQIARVLRPNGVLFLQTGNKGEMTDRRDGERFGEDWGTPEHRFHFSHRALGRLLGTAGLSARAYAEERWTDFLFSRASMEIRSSRSAIRTAAKRTLSHLPPALAALRAGAALLATGAQVPSASIRLLATKGEA